MRKILKYTILFLIVSCGQANQDSSKLNSTSAFDPTPANQDDVISQMRRYLNQQKFANVEGMSNMSKRAAMSDGLEAAAPSGVQSAEQREVQDSDVFKFDPQDKSKLYLLNSVRGLQRVDFSEGVDKAKLEARAAATGNYPDDMYFYSKGEKSYVLVVENNWYDREGGYSHSSASRVVVYDAKSLKIVKTIEVAGELSDHRLVGNILYVATSEWPSYSWWDMGRNQNEETNAKGHIVSIDLSAKDLKLVDQKETSLPIASSENMNIVEVKAEKGWKYYVVATLANSRWGFWDQTSVVEVMDISDAKGAITPIMIAKPQGFIEERTQTLIKDDTLIVVSNYTPKYIQNGLSRVAVETFKFPTSDSPRIDKDEADYRLKHLDRAVKRGGVTFNSAGYDKLLGDKDTGLRGVFVEMESDSEQNGESVKVTKLAKVVSDTFTSYGSENSLHAVIRDVRVSGNSLYTFWVPSDRARMFNDPLEVYDISAPREGVTHVAHMEFPGRVDRAFPMQYDGRQMILALGVVEPGQDNEERAEHGQALLFEIVKRGKTLSIVNDGAMNLVSPKLRPIFQTEDKMVQMRMVDKDKGFILFAAQQRDNWWMNGGKLIGFDLSKIEAGEVFTEGAFIPAEAGYLKRVFENLNVEAIHSFTDEALATFKPTKVKGLGIGAQDEVAQALQVLELARNIAGYETMVQKDKSQIGVQIVSHQNWYDRDNVATTELRFTAVDRADAELPATQQKVIQGRYVGHYLSEDSKALIVIVQTEKWITQEQGQRYRGVDATLAYKVVNGEVSEPVKIADEQGYPEYIKTQKLLLVRSDKTLKSIAINSNKDLKVADMTSKGCEAIESTEDNNRRIYPQLKEISGNLYYTYGVYGRMEDKNLAYQTKYLMPVTLSTDTLQCGKAVNVPGEVVSVSSDLKTAVTVDESLKVLVEQKQPAAEEGQEPVVTFRAITKKNLVALALDLTKGLATLKRLEDIGSAQGYGIKVVDDALLFVDADQSYGMMPMHGMRMSMDFMPRFGGGDTTYSVNVLRVDNDYNFIRTSFALDSKENSSESIQLAAVLDEGKAANGKVLLTTQGNSVRAYRFSVTEGLKEKLLLQSVDENFEKSKAEESIRLSHAYALGGYSYYGNSDSTVNFNTTLRSVEVPAGTYGVLQFYINE